MIQRIQTLYLLAVVALGIALIWLPVVEFVTPEEASELQIWEMTAIGGVPLQGLWGLLVAKIEECLVVSLCCIWIVRRKIVNIPTHVINHVDTLCHGYIYRLF